MTFTVFLLLGITSILWIYIAVRVATRAVLRTLEEARKEER